MLSMPSHTAGLKAWVQDAWEKSKNPESTCWIIVTTQIKAAQIMTGPTTILTAIAAAPLPECFGCCCVLLTVPPIEPSLDRGLLFGVNLISPGELEALE
jgi:hypothetical protein